MYPVLLEVPTYLIGALVGALAAVVLWGQPGEKPSAWLPRGALGAGVGLVGGFLVSWRADLPTAPLRAYGLFILAGFFAGVRLGQHLAKRIGIPPEHVMDLCMWGLGVGLLFARLWFVGEHWASFSPWGPDGGQGFYRILAIWDGGLRIFGAVVGACLVAVIYSTAYRLPLLPLMDALAPGLALGMAIGRLGCFCNGCCFGKTCDLPWALSFPPSSDAAHHYCAAGAHELASPHLHPVQLYSGIGTLLVALFLYQLWFRKQFHGQVLCLMLALAGVTRFMEEFFRADNGPAWSGVIDTLSPAQVMGLVLLAVGAIAYACLVRTPLPKPGPAA
jgi:phosphatidylglycerol:prolipoprotein diacylglycerol transferase